MDGALFTVPQMPWLTCFPQQPWEVGVVAMVTAEQAEAQRGKGTCPRSHSFPGFSPCILSTGPKPHADTRAPGIWMPKPLPRTSQT